MLGVGAGSIQDMINRFRNKRAMLSGRKIRFKSGRRFFEEKPAFIESKGKQGSSRKPSDSHLDEIRIKLKCEARFNQLAVVFMFIVCIVALA